MTALTTCCVTVALVRLVSFDRALTVHTSGGDYGIPLRSSLAAARQLSHNELAGRSFIISDNGDVVSVFQYFAAAGIVSGATVANPSQALPVPRNGATARYLLDRGSSDTPAAAILERLTDTTLPAGPLPVLFATPAQLQTPLEDLVPGAHMVGPYAVGSGLQLVAAEVGLPGPQGPLRATLVWKVTDPTPYTQQPVRIFLHLYDAGRQTVAQQDALGYSGAYWQAGDVLITWFSTQPPRPLPAGRYTLVSGLYAVPTLKVFPVTGPGNQTLGGEIPLGTLIVPDSPNQRPSG